MSTAKETLYFEDYYAKGPRWYGRFFKNQNNAATAKATGEISNTYIFSQLAAERIAKDFPNMRILATLRDPTDRAYSHYLFLRRNGELNCSFEEALVRRPDIKTRGNYFQHLEPYRRLFHAHQVGIFIYDDLLKDAASYAKQLFDFIGVDPIPDPSVLHERVLEAGAARNRLVANSVVWSAGLIRKFGFPDIVTQVKTSWVAKLVFRPLRKHEQTAMSLHIRRQLDDYYRPDVELLSNWLGRDLASTWLE
jgi:hypothetical protein